MRIGIDVDDTLSNTSGIMYPLMLEADKLKRNSGVIHEDKHIFEANGRFDWSEDEIDEFLADNIERYSSIFPLIKNADKVISMLHEHGHEIYIVTARYDLHWRDKETSTINWLEANNIRYDRLIFSKSRDKTEEIKKYGIDLMIDDSISSCLRMQDNGIDCIVKITPNNYRNLDLNKFQYKAINWAEIYQLINYIQNQKVFNLDK